MPLRREYARAAAFGWGRRESSERVGSHKWIPNEEDLGLRERNESCFARCGVKVIRKKIKVFIFIENKGYRA